jgi:large-conductance mechanosensitive channel
MRQEFKEFAMQGSASDLKVGSTSGALFTGVARSLIEDGTPEFCYSRMLSILAFG